MFEKKTTDSFLQVNKKSSLFFLSFVS